MSAPDPTTPSAGDAEALKFAWHDVTCPEAGECRSRSLHALAGSTTYLPLIERAVLAAGYLSPVQVAARIRAEKAEALREAAEAMNVEGLTFKPGGWGSNPADQQTIDVMVKAVQWLRDRADRIGGQS